MFFNDIFFFKTLLIVDFLTLDLETATFCLILKLIFKLLISDKIIFMLQIRREKFQIYSLDKSSR